MIDTIISIIANVFSIFGITITDVKKAPASKKFKNKKFRNICVIFLFLALIICFYIYKQKSITVTNVMLSEDSLIMNIDEPYTLIATVLYSNNSMNNDVLWSSSNNSIATVDQNGLITALADGNVTIIAQASKNNTTSSAECAITIKSPPSGYSISVKQTSIDCYAYVYVTPYDDDITKIQICGLAPSGKLSTPNIDENNLYSFDECGTWTIYALIENDAGTYEPQKPEDYATIEVTNVTNILDNSLGMFNDMFQQLAP